MQVYFNKICTSFETTKYIKWLKTASFHKAWKQTCHGEKGTAQLRWQWSIQQHGVGADFVNCVGLILGHWKQSQKVKTKVLKYVIIKGQNPDTETLMHNQ
jgi:hypothetical protein